MAICGGRVLWNLILVCLLRFAVLAGAQEIKSGTVLRSTESRPYWVSPTKNFSFGFFSKDGGGSFFVGVGFAKLNNSAAAEALAWKALSVSLEKGSYLDFQKGGDLVLFNSSGAALWRTETANKGATAALMRDNGNFVILSKNSTPIWQSFDHPVDTLVIGQVLRAGKTLKSGDYSFGLDSKGNLTLQWRQNVSYWNVTTGQRSDVLNVSLSASAELSLVNSSGTSLWLVRSVDYTDETVTLRLARLDPDGNLRLYAWHDDSNSFEVGWQAVEDQCLVYGWCGNLGVCMYNGTAPTCICPSGDFVAVDANDPRKGCRRLDDLSTCSNNQTMVRVEHTQFLAYPPETSSSVYSLGLKDCEGNCLSDSSCYASTLMSDGSGKCRFRVSSFSSGYLSLASPSISFVKVCGSTGRPLSLPLSSPSQITKTSSQGKKAVVIAVSCSAFALVVFELGLVWLCWRNGSRFRTPSSHYNLLEYASGAPMQFSHSELQQCTKNFKDKLGAGGFGMVYKGTLPNGALVAVKRLEGIQQGEKQFRMEVAIIGSTHHLNLVKLVGFCSERKHRLLVYEFMKNKSLDRFLFAEADKKSKKLDWNTRFSIAVGTARGIAYLHEECRTCIIHCDIKPENILLDENFVAKVSDFGLAKLLHVRDHPDRSLSSVRGTRGYLAPEWLANQPVTSKFDVFSYGMVLLELVGGKRNFEMPENSRRVRFSKWAFEQFQKGDFSSIVDKRLGGNYDEDQVLRAVQVSFWCIQEHPSMRPSMGKVVQMLEGILPIEKPPFPKSCEGFQSTYSVSTSNSTSSTLATPTRASESLGQISEFGPNTGEVLSSGR